LFLDPQITGNSQDLVWQWLIFLQLFEGPGFGLTAKGQRRQFIAFS